MTRKVRESELDAMRQRAERAESQNEKLRIELAERDEECEELRAHCERLRSALQQMVDEAAHLAGFSANTERVVVEALRETPDQSLREIRAEAVEKAASEFLSGVDAGNKDETAADASVRVYKLLKKIREGKE